jgi:8-oxo-dGTP diphosphatase
VTMAEYRNPKPTVDVVILLGGDRVVLVERRNEPRGWALPGGFVDEGETLEAAAAREAREETGLAVRLVEQFHAYSDPRRDPRGHTISTVFIGQAAGTPAGGDDAARAEAFPWTALPAPIVFDHAEILSDVRRYLLTGGRRRA